MSAVVTSSSHALPVTCSPGDDESTTWINYSSMDTTKYNGLCTLMALTSSFVLQPFNVVATRQQAGSLVTGDKGTPRTVIEALSQYRKELGWKGLFRGFLPIATMGVPSQIVYLSITERTREILQKNIRMVFPEIASGLIDAAQSTATALMANMVSLIPYVPADVISSRMVIQSRKGIGMRNMMGLIWKEGYAMGYGGRGGIVGGVAGFYRGYNISLIYGVVLSAQWWGAYSICRREFSNIEVLKSYPLALDAATGLVAGLVSTCVAHPIDTLKTRIMTGTSIHMPIGATLRSIIQKEGVKALWKGMPAAMYQGALSSTGFALSYEVVKRICQT